MAKKRSKKIKNKKQIPQKVGFWKKTWFVITNKTDDATVSLSMALSSLMALFFNIIALILLIIGLTFMAMVFIGFFKSFDILSLILNGSFALLLPLLALIMRGIANEIGREKNKDYIMAAFSGIVSFVALIVALIALFKEVG